MLYDASPDNILKAAGLIANGEVVAFPTETVYGLGADAFSASAAKKIYQLKKRPAKNPLIVHINSFDQLRLVADLSSSRRIYEQLELLKRFWPGPLTVVLPKSDKIPPEVSAGLSSVAVRYPSHPVAQELVAAAKTPIAAPSANRSGYISATRAEHVDRSFGEELEMILDGGPCQVGLESTIVSLLDEVPTLLRPGAVSYEELAESLGEVKLSSNLSISESSEEKALAPGMLSKHYSPRTPIAFLGANRSSNGYPAKTGLITFGYNKELKCSSSFLVVDELSRSGNLNEVAHGLFAALYEQDQLGLDLIVVEQCPDKGLGRAIMDRLTRAAKEE